MGEGTSEQHVRHATGRRAGGSDKDRSRHLKIIPPVAERLLWQVARRHRHEALLILLAKHYLRPEDAVRSRLGDDGLHVPGFARPLRVDPADRDTLAEWLGRRRRPRSAQAVRNVLGQMLRPDLVAELEAHNATTGACTAWGDLLDIGVRALRRLATERAAEAAGGEEAVYHELLHDPEADPADTLRWLSADARRRIEVAAQAVVADIVRARQRLGVDG